MPNQITSAGLETKSFTEIYQTLVAGMQSIYGADINVDQQSPDGQLLNIFIQAIIDNLELLQDVYNSFSIDGAYGVSLDQRVAVNGITRRQGTYTFTDVEVTVDRALTLDGLDGELNDADGSGYTVADDAGNNYVLAETQAIAGAGTYTFSFRAQNIGRVETVPNTITNKVTVVLGVTDVNNPTATTMLGQDEETDAALRIRHARSFLLAATGPADAIEAALANVAGVTDAFVAENDTNAEELGVPAHGIWAIVDGGSDESIGQAIYSKKSPGSAMRGDETFTVTRPNGSTFIAKYDRPILEDLYVKFTLIPRASGVTFDTDLVKTQLQEKLTYTLNQSANIGDMVSAMLEITPQGVIKDVGVSNDGVTYFDVLDPTDFQHKFVVDASRIDITI